MGNPVSDITKIRVDGKNADPSFPLAFLRRRNLDHIDHHVYGDHFHNIVNWFRVNQMRDCYVDAQDTVYCVCGTYRIAKWESTSSYKMPTSQVGKIKEVADNIGTFAETAMYVATGNIAGLAAEAAVLSAEPLYRKLLTRKDYYVVLTQDDSMQPIHTKHLKGKELCWMAAD